MSNDTQALVTQMSLNTFTVADMNRRVGLLRECFEVALFHVSELSTAQVCTQHLANHFEQNDVAAITQWLDLAISKFTRVNLASHIKAIQSAVDEMPVLTLYIPVPFPEQEVTVIGTWCRAQCHESVLLDVHVDTNVTGGCSFVWQDTVHNFTFQSRVKDHPGLITRLLSSYA